MQQNAITTKSRPGIVFPAAAMPVSENAALAILCAQHVRQGATMERETLILPLSAIHLRYGSLLLDAVGKAPGLKDRIIFKEAGALRPYDDVIWDLTGERAADLARTVWHNARQPQHIVITPAILGRADNPYETICADIRIAGKSGEVCLRPVIAAETRWGTPAIGEHKIIQTNNIALEKHGENFYHLKIKAAAGCHHSLQRATANSHDFAL